jgi:hypothetical protein
VEGVIVILTGTMKNEYLQVAGFGGMWGVRRL